MLAHLINSNKNNLHNAVLLLVAESEIFACVFSYSSSFPIKMHATNAKTQKIEPDPKFFWRMKVSEAVCKREVVFIF